MSRPEFLLATNNQHKKYELQQILSGLILKTPEDIGIDFECEETGTSFLENSMLKALTLFELAGKPVIADDSGLCVDALDGAPGIFSARYGSSEKGVELESSERNRYLLDNLEHLRDESERSATFVCCMTTILSKYRVYTVQETMLGQITREPAGCGGFGYDPVFYLPAFGKTVAELSDAEKNRVSHRGRAAARLGILLEGVKIE